MGNIQGKQFKIGKSRYKDYEKPSPDDFLRMKISSDFKNNNIIYFKKQLQTNYDLLSESRAAKTSSYISNGFDNASR